MIISTLLQHDTWIPYRQIAERRIEETYSKPQK
jgi:hypothetical protein